MILSQCIYHKKIAIIEKLDFLFQLCLVYMFEYVAQGSAAKVRPKAEYNTGCPELYAALSLCYQVYYRILSGVNATLIHKKTKTIFNQFFTGYQKICLLDQKKRNLIQFIHT